MNEGGIVPLLSWAGGLGAVLAIAVYFVVLARRPQWVRLLNGSGLFFTGVGLSQVATLAPAAARGGHLFTAVVATFVLIAAVLVQAWAALQNRKSWDGVERRLGGEAEMQSR